MFDTGKDRHLCFRGEISPFFIDSHIRTKVAGSDIPYQEYEFKKVKETSMIPFC